MKATRRTYFATAIAFLVAMGAIAVAATVDQPTDEGLTRIWVVPIVAIGVCAVAYRFCGYEKAPLALTVNQESELAGLESRAIKRRGMILIAVGVACFALMTFFRGYTAVLAFAGRDLDARVLSYSQAKPGWTREGDWFMDYKFEFEGRVFTGRATYAPKRRPEPSASIPIRFLSFAPTVSAPANDISTSALGGYLLSGWAVFLGVRFLRRAQRGAGS